MPSERGSRHTPLDLAIRALAARERSEASVRARLQRAGVQPAEADETIQTLIRLGYLDDSRFARERAASLAARGYGDAVILARLAHDGVTRDAARDALAALEPEGERARRLSFDRPARTPPELAKWLSRRGFGQEAIETVLAGAADVDAPGASAIP